MSVLGVSAAPPPDYTLQHQHQLLRLFQPPRCFTQKYLKTHRGGGGKRISPCFFFFIRAGFSFFFCFSSARTCRSHLQPERSGAPIIKQKTGGKKKKKKNPKDEKKWLTTLSLTFAPSAFPLYLPVSPPSPKAALHTHTLTPLCTIRLSEDRDASSLRRGTVR